MPKQEWERLPDEGAAPFEAFQGYLDLGPQRTIHAAMQHHLARASQVGRNGSKWQRRYLLHPKPRKYMESVYHRWRAWSAAFSWLKRAGLYDDYVAYVGRKQHLEAEAARAESDAAEESRQARLALQEARSLRAIAARIQVRILEVLQDNEALQGVTLRRQKVIVVANVLDENNKPTGQFRRTEITTPGVLELLPLSASANQIGQQLERLILGLATDRTVAMTPAEEERAALARVTQRAIEESEERILREKAEGRRPGAAPGGAAGPASAAPESPGGETAGEAADPGEGDVDVNTGGGE